MKQFRKKMSFLCVFLANVKKNEYLHLLLQKSTFKKKKEITKNPRGQ